MSSEREREREREREKTETKLYLVQRYLLWVTIKQLCAAATLTVSINTRATVVCNDYCDYTTTTTITTTTTTLHNCSRFTVENICDRRQSNWHMQENICFQNTLHICYWKEPHNLSDSYGSYIALHHTNIQHTASITPLSHWYTIRHKTWILHEVCNE